MLFPVIFTVLVDLYVFQAVKSSFSGSKASTQRVIYIIYFSLSSITYIALTILLFKGYTDWHGWTKNLLVGIAQTIFFAKILIIPFIFIDDIIRGLRWTAGLFGSTSEDIIQPNGISRLQFLNRIGLAIGSLTFGGVLYGVLRGGFNYQKIAIKLPIKNLPEEWRGLKIVQISDFHLGSFASTTPVEKIVELVNQENADIIFFTGDLVNSLAKETEPYLDILKTLHCKTKIYSILGNHDYGTYVEWDSDKEMNANFQKLIDTQKNILGWDLLMDENRILERNGKKLAIIGVQYIGHTLRFGKFGNLDKAYSGAEDADIQLLLSHDPSHWDKEVSQNKLYQNIQHTFSGHTHGFQFGVEIPSLGLKWSPAKYVYPHWAGLYNSQEQYLYVNRGIGFLGYPGRLGISPEITVFELVNA